MKQLLLVLLLLISAAVKGAVFEEYAYNADNMVFIRLLNTDVYPVSCYYRDQYNFITFIVGPRSYSMWYPVYGSYVWQCK